MELEFVAVATIVYLMNVIGVIPDEHSRATEGILDFSHLCRCYPDPGRTWQANELVFWSLASYFVKIQSPTCLPSCGQSQATLSQPEPGSPQVSCMWTRSTTAQSWHKIFTGESFGKGKQGTKERSQSQDERGQECEVRLWRQRAAAIKNSVKKQTTKFLQLQRVSFSRGICELSMDHL